MQDATAEIAGQSVRGARSDVDRAALGRAEEEPGGLTLILQEDAPELARLLARGIHEPAAEYAVGGVDREVESLNRGGRRQRDVVG